MKQNAKYQQNLGVMQRVLNKYWYEFFTGFPSPKCAFGTNYERNNFLPRLKKKKVYIYGCRPSQISPFMWSIVEEADHLPSEYWPYFRYSQIHTVNLFTSGIMNFGVINLARHLRNKELKKVYLGYNAITDEGAIGFAKNLKCKQIVRVYLGNNNISPDTKELLLRDYPHIRWIF